ncbi:PaaI family thioesterase [Nonomuraea sp. K274]|uniref:PaaI family thioesterase n=1 Tax=Nonomuraea cypriaca TaxID=1187855 RepID=A0A931ANG4_9ACTN|nr:PaaI family thioesterase [Nonomuraea cypriaca]
MDGDGLLAHVKAALDRTEPGFGTFFLARFLDLTITYDDGERCCAVELPYAPYLANPQGSLHGGVIATAMDISMGHLCRRYLSVATTVDLQVRFFRPIIGDCRCEARFLRPGGRLVHMESRMYDTAGRQAAHATGAWHRLDQSTPTTSIGGAGDRSDPQ